VRAFTPWPGAFTALTGNSTRRRLKIIRSTIEENCRGQPGEVLQADKTGLLVACGDGALRIHDLQLEGGRKMTVGELLTGHPLQPGTKLG
jgi:methionyl-tRNA formyltransferase